MHFCCNSDRISEKVFLRGGLDFIKALDQQIRATIDEKKLDVYATLIAPRYHKELRQSIFEIGRKTGAHIHLPGDTNYDKLLDPADMSEIEDVLSIVKITGTRDASMQAIQELDVRSVCAVNVAN
jgi:hypothetical protein